MADALEAVRKLNRAGISATLDSLGENTTSTAQAVKAADVYHDVIDRIHKEKLDANISLKLSQMGLHVCTGDMEQIVSGIVEHSSRAGTFLRIDMEESSHTSPTVALTQRLVQRFGRDAVGTVIQAYLYRSDADIRALGEAGIRVRLCKGAYKEQADVAYPLKSDVDTNYVHLARLLLDQDTYHGFATHDEKIVRSIISYAKKRAIDPTHFEFQMLYGIRRNLQAQLVKEGYRVRVYVPFGDEWYPYFMRRLAERPANLLFLLKNTFRS